MSPARRPRALALALALLAAAGTPLTACATPPQIVAIQPDRGAQDVPSNSEVRIRFDRPVDQASVASRFTVTPQVEGSIAWSSPAELVFRHVPFRPSTLYSVRLRGGYRDREGHSNQLDHGWQFRTEPPPALTASSPAPHERNVDPASILTLQFTREMDIASLARAVSIAPSLRFSLRPDPSDPRRAIVAPEGLLDPRTTYSVTVTRDARDVDGNPLPAGIALDFTTGGQRPLRHWVTFIARRGESSAGIWVVDENRLPRLVAALPGSRYAWSLDGMHLLVRTTDGEWFELSVGGDRRPMPFAGDWAAFLAPGAGHVFLERGRLSMLPPAGPPIVIDQGVSEAAVAPSGRQVAYVVHTPAGDEVRGYDAQLRSHFRLQFETGAVDGLAWAPDGSGLAYRLTPRDPLRAQLRVRELSGHGALLTLATGEVSPPAWQDPRHLVTSATVPGPYGAPVTRAFRLSVGEPATGSLSIAQAIPSPRDVEVRDPAPSPDGHQLAFLAPTAGGDQVWVMNVDGTGLVQLTGFDLRSFPYACAAPAWTPG